MGKLNIAHHKSYHPYRLDNIERVRRDEAAAKLKQTEDADRALVADAESRMDVLRSRAGISTPPHSPPPGDRDAEDPAPPVASGSGSSSIPMSDGHINLFADLEEHAAALAARASKSKPALTDTDRGLALAPTKQDLNPWYSSSGPKDPDSADQKAAARRQRDLARQSRADPLASIPAHLMGSSSSRTTPSSLPSHRHPPHRRHPHPPPPQPLPQPPPSSASREGRLARESSERERALALVRRKRAESATATPSTVHGGGYTDVFNRLEVEDAHRERDRDRAWRQRRWEDDAGNGPGRRPRH